MTRCNYVAGSGNKPVGFPDSWTLLSQICFGRQNNMKAKNLKDHRNKTNSSFTDPFWREHNRILGHRRWNRHIVLNVKIKGISTFIRANPFSLERIGSSSEATSPSPAKLFLKVFTPTVEPFPPAMNELSISTTHSSTNRSQQPTDVTYKVRQLSTVTRGSWYFHFFRHLNSPFFTMFPKAYRQITM